MRKILLSVETAMPVKLFVHREVDAVGITFYIFCLAFFAFASGCGTAPKPAPTVASPPTAPKTTPVTPSTYPQTGPRGGAYYKDDGPGQDAPANLEATPDAQPKIEGLLRGPNRPYVVFGKTYTPQTVDQPLKQTGIGSWYGRKFHGQRTSSGEIYNMYGMSAAHPTMLLPSYARVTNLENGQVVIVRVNDRGPFHSNRIIDLSYTAALRLGYVARGSTQLLVERLTNDEIARLQREGTRSVETVAVQLVSSELTAAKVDVAVGSSSAVDPQQLLNSDFTQSNSSSSTSTTASSSPNTSSPIPTTTQASTSGAQIYLQLGAFSSQPNASSFAEHARRELSPLLEASSQTITIATTGTVYRAQLGPYETREQANAMGERIRQLMRLTPVIVGR